MNYQITIISRDRLFFNDARPLVGSNIGSGASWPMPGVFHSALLSALHSVYDPDWESKHSNLTEKERKKKGIRYSLGGLKTYGPFPSVDNQLYFPVPADIDPSGKVMNPTVLPGSSNLPKPLKYSVASSSPPSKEQQGEWISASELERYLKEGSCTTTETSDLYAAETSPGVGINPETRSNEDKKFYQAEYLRLNERFKVAENEYRPVRMTAFAECEARRYTGEKVDVLEKFFSNSRNSIIFGGQRGVAFLEAVRMKKFCSFDKPVSVRIKWVLLTPGLFNNGWLPDWVDAERGDVKLKHRPEKGSLSRKEWRKKISEAPFIDAKLVAARIADSQHFSGWKLDPEKDNAGGSPKATRAAVPPGSVYYFECGSEAEASKLIDELHCRSKSSLLGEQGFGLGVCGTWQLNSIK